METTLPSFSDSWLEGRLCVVTAQCLEQWQELLSTRGSCFLCGKKPRVGSEIRWVYTNGSSPLPPGNPFVCGDCDKKNLAEEMKSRVDKALRMFRDPHLRWLFWHLGIETKKAKKRLGEYSRTLHGAGDR